MSGIWGGYFFGHAKCLKEDSGGAGICTYGPLNFVFLIYDHVFEMQLLRFWTKNASFGQSAIKTREHEFSGNLVDEKFMSILNT